MTDLQHKNNVEISINKNIQIKTKSEMKTYQVTDVLVHQGKTPTNGHYVVTHQNANKQWYEVDNYVTQNEGAVISQIQEERADELNQHGVIYILKVVEPVKPDDKTKQIVNRKPANKRKLCKFHRQGRCKYGDQCENFHENLNIICKFHLKGNCWFEGRCGFRHPYNQSNRYLGGYQRYQANPNTPDYRYIIHDQQNTPSNTAYTSYRYQSPYNQTQQNAQNYPLRRSESNNPNIPLTRKMNENQHYRQPSDAGRQHAGYQPNRNRGNRY